MSLSQSIAYQRPRYPRGIFWLWMVAGCIMGCISEYVPDTGDFTPKLVVDGLITNQAGPYTVRLYYSEPYLSRDPTTKLRGATVFIKDNQGGQTQLMEVDRGNYATTDSTFRGVVGRYYQIEIVLSDGKQYRSIPELLKAPTPVDTVYGVFKEGNVINDRFEVITEFKDKANQENYFKWKWKHFQEISVCKIIDQTPPVPPIRRIYNCCSPCWSILSSSQVDVLSDALSDGKTIKHMLTTIPYDSKDPYYLLIEQYELTKNAYLFWKQTENQTTNAGGIFDTPPSQIIGNIQCVSTPSEQVLGYFVVAGLTVKPSYVLRNGISKPPYQPINTLDNLQKINVPVCEPCQESLGRTAIRPPAWK
ncbi:MAG: DUF4249 domain-containing protein [Spirosomataceae bacterium]